VQFALAISTLKSCRAAPGIWRPTLPVRLDGMQCFYSVGWLRKPASEAAETVQ